MDINTGIVQVLVECDICNGTGSIMAVNVAGSLVSTICENCRGDGEIIISLTLRELKVILSEIKE